MKIGGADVLYDIVVVTDQDSAGPAIQFKHTVAVCPA
jgi:hypothetical protein